MRALIVLVQPGSAGSVPRPARRAEPHRLVGVAPLPISARQNNSALPSQIRPGFVCVHHDDCLTDDLSRELSHYSEDRELKLPEGKVLAGSFIIVGIKVSFMPTTRTANAGIISQNIK